MTDLSIGSDTFRVEVEGDATKPVLLLSNSLGSDMTLWDAQMPELLKTFRVVRYDSRGHGGSTLAGAPYSIARLGRDALGILDALEIEKAHFVGISMGGAVGLWLLAHAPHRIERIVLANTTARFGDAESWNQRIVRVLNEGMESIADTTMARWFSADFAAKEPERVGAVRAVFEAVSPEGYAACCAALRDMDVRGAFESQNTPVLVISGSDDASIAKGDTAALLAGFPHAKHIELDAHHISNIEADAAFTKAVLAFLTAKSPAKPAKRIAPPAARPGSRRVGIRRATAARIPLAPATSASKSAAAKGGAKPTVTKTAGRKADAAPAKGKARPPAAPTKSAAKASAKATPAKTATAARVAASPKTKPTASRTKPGAAISAKTPARQTKAAPKAAAKTASRPSAKSLKALAAKGAATKKPAGKALASKNLATNTGKAKGTIKTPSPAKAAAKTSAATTRVKAPATPAKKAVVTKAAAKATNRTTAKTATKTTTAKSQTAKKQVTKKPAVKTPAIKAPVAKAQATKTSAKKTPVIKTAKAKTITAAPHKPSATKTASRAISKTAKSSAKAGRRA